MIPLDRVFCDTGFFYASLASGDRHYERAGELLEQCHSQQVRMLSTWEILSEAVTLLAYRLHPSATVQFLDTMKPALALVPTTDAVRSQRSEYSDSA